jgi:hypothetical protein
MVSGASTGGPVQLRFPVKLTCGTVTLGAWFAENCTLSRFVPRASASIWLPFKQ